MQVFSYQPASVIAMDEIDREIFIITGSRDVIVWKTYIFQIYLYCIPLESTFYTDSDSQ